MTLEIANMKRILLAAQFPNLNVLVLVGFSPDIVLRYFTEELSITHLFKTQIKCITVKFGNEVFTDESFTDACNRILSICTKCSYSNMKQSSMIMYSKLSFHHRFENTCYSSYLHTLIINVKYFDDCLCLLDGRLNNLSSLIVHVMLIKRSSRNTHSHEKLTSLKEFSLTSYCYTIGYDHCVVPLLRRMINLEKLTLSLNVIQFTVIDGIDLNEKILCCMPKLEIFTSV